MYKPLNSRRHHVLYVCNHIGPVEQFITLSRFFFVSAVRPMQLTQALMAWTDAINPWVTKHEAGTMNPTYSASIFVQSTCNEHLQSPESKADLCPISFSFCYWMATLRCHVIVLMGDLDDDKLQESSKYRKCRIKIVDNAYLVFLESCTYIRLPSSSCQIKRFWTNTRMQLLHVSTNPDGLNIHIAATMLIVMANIMDTIQTWLTQR